MGNYLQTRTRQEDIPLPLPVADEFVIISCGYFKWKLPFTSPQAIAGRHQAPERATWAGVSQRTNDLPGSGGLSRPRVHGEVLLRAAMKPCIEQGSGPRSLMRRSSYRDGLSWDILGAGHFNANLLVLSRLRKPTKFENVPNDSRTKKVLWSEQTLGEPLFKGVTKKCFRTCTLGSKPYGQKSSPISLRVSSTCRIVQGSMTFSAAVW